ncbi:MAG: aldehyde dehydrogenase [Aeromicrobium sp.]|nr:aldehyde dehydrogenase [Aeromicrobium sp.]
MTDGREWRMLVDGDLRPAEGGRHYTTTNPSSGAVLAQVPDASSADVDDAVAGALAASREWRRVAPRDRAHAVRRVADVVAAHREELARLDADDLGSPVGQMRLDVDRAVDQIRMFADWALDLSGEVVPVASTHLNYTMREPYGVVARIIPFNHPVMFAAAKIAAPLVAGNAVVLKPAHQTPLSALRLGELVVDILPPGLLAVLTGSGPETPRALVRHPDVHRIAFIGGELTGRAILTDAASVGVKNVTLELGGKNAVIVFEDADIDAAVEGVVTGMNLQASTGQSCGSTSRLFVHRRVAEEVTARVARRFDELRLGAAGEESTEVGPVVTAEHRDRVVGFVERAVAAGARRMTADRAVPGEGWFVAPTLLADVAPDAEIACEEVFGPVLIVEPFDDEDTAVSRANAVRHGLTASVWTRDLARAHRCVHLLEAGYVWVNDTSRHFPGMPYGGFKASGLGREESRDELLGFTQTKAVNIAGAGVAG